MPLQDVGLALERIEAMLGKGESRAAENAARALLLASPEHHDAQVLLGHALRLQGRAGEALDVARHAQSLAVKHPASRMLLIDLLLEQGLRDEGLEILDQLAADADAHPPRLLQDVAQRYTMLGLHVEAEGCHARALKQQPDNAQFIYNHATSLIALGRLVAAEAALDRVIALKPDDADAWYNRATLRKQTSEHHHVQAIEAQLGKTPAGTAPRVALGYALAKELEDLREYPRSFAALKEAADTRRRHLRYRVEDDLETMQLIAAAFDGAFFAREHRGHDDARPLFIVGLPRSGTTLVDRILSSHSTIRSRGETSDLVMALVRQAGKVANKAELVQRSTTLDFADLGQAYCANLGDGPEQRLIDKTPVNFLYLGIIAAALPNARIIHLRRNPMDACYAMYKTLFRMAYPFSYDLGDLARYWIAYDRLMKHWKKVLPAAQFLELSYEDLVADQEGVSRRLVDFVGVPWQDECLAFERNPEPSLTASAAQVRQPIYTSSVALWRRYENELVPLRAAFEAAGVAIEHPDNGATP
ncbi:MAG TPA: sulfotransferase [Dokdonella sp.]|uniref:tetratricopeptide repeat-containing sulfotransferase family protein n=1 Tax=Dokdonella sp. TaxID=2291710 RepID=UPI002D7F7649|nr:sulfotransferase [Dokdonella sp.]HET9032868.1 sulfotransferase [Dokdonella sp.]